MRAIPLVLVLALVPDHAPRTADPVLHNDNREPAGELRAGVLELALEARLAEWRPDGPDRPGTQVHVFGETGGAASVPGPLLRVQEGTEVRATVRNTIAGTTLTVIGLSTDTVRVPAGASRDVRFVAGTPGTYFYYGFTTGSVTPRTRLDSQLSGALVVDPRGADPALDRVFVLGFWTPADPARPPDDSTQLRFVINGRPWPHTERLTYDQGEAIRWRIVNTSSAVHPMHLHGFYYRVDSRGDGRTDTVYPDSASRQQVVTERMAPFTTMSLTWVPDRPGNWLFHCHDNVHILPIFAFLDDSPVHTATKHDDHALASMGGLVLGVFVRPRGEPGQEVSAPRRRLRLLAASDVAGAAGETAYGFLLDDGSGAAAARPSPAGPTLVLRRGEPVAITVVNRLDEPTTVHWHGIELDSYFDGVGGFAGMPGSLAPVIAPADSFEARFTPPRAGTFIYHTHVDETRQQRAGLAGPLIVIDPDSTWDPTRDLVVMLSTPRRNSDQDRILLNGSLDPAPIELRAGQSYRLRIINIHTYRPSMRLSIRRDTAALTWRPLAKDGADLPPERRSPRPAMLQTGNGETYDFELVPDAPGVLRLDVVTGVGAPLASLQMNVR